MNWAPRSLMMVDGKPKMEIQWTKRARHTVSVVMSAMGTARGNLVVRSMTVSMYLQPLDSFKGPTKSTCMDVNLRWGIGIDSIGGF